MAYTATYQGSVIALQLQDAAVRWRTKISTRLPMAIAQKRLFVIGELGEVTALDIDDGRIVWQQRAFRGHGVSQPVVLNNRVIVGDSSGKIHTLDIETGNLVQSKKVVSWGDYRHHHRQFATGSILVCGQYFYLNTITRPLRLCKTQYSSFLRKRLCKNPTFVILNPPSPPYQGEIEWKAPLIRGI